MDYVTNCIGDGDRKMVMEARWESELAERVGVAPLKSKMWIRLPKGMAE